MIRKSYPGAMWPEALPSGAWIALKLDAAHKNVVGLIGSHDIPLPAEGLGYPRISDATGVLQVAGEASHLSGGRVMHWTGTAWVLRPETGIHAGDSGAAFWPDGRLELSTPEKHYGSQGIRWIDDRVHTGDETYGYPALSLSQYTRQGEIVVGQGALNGGVTLVQESFELGIPHWRKRLANGECYGVRFTRADNDLAVAWWEKAGQTITAHLVWLTVAEIDSLPDDVPVPTPEPEPEPEPTPMPGPPANAKEIVKRIHAEVNPPHTVAGAFEVTKRFAWEQRHTGAGLLLKPGGENIVNWKGRWFSAGRIVYPDGHLYKLLSDIPTTNGPGWQDEGVDPDLIPRWVAPMEPADITPGPGPTPPPSSGTIDAAVQAVIAAALAGVLEEVESLQARIAALEAQPAPQPGPGFPEKIALKSDHGKYGSVQPDGSVVFDRDEIGGWEIFTVIRKD